VNPTQDAVSVEDWNEQVSARNNHPTFASDGPNTVSPSEGIIDALVAFLNFDDAKWDKVFSDIELVTTVGNDTQKIKHTLVATADAARGAQFYGNWCFRCHEAPDNDSDNNSLISIDGFIDDQGSLSELRHIAQWGRAGTSMTRSRLGYPTSADVADVIAFLNSVKAGEVSDGVGFTGVGDAIVGKTKYDAHCKGCHVADDLAKKHFSMQRDLSEVSSIMKDVAKLSQKEINDLAAFFTSDAVKTDQ